ncbi:phosphate ABC transporter permease PstA [Mesoterricola silvestris]|uniref:Phosphate transport system permease protein PstA n=1 Tax=Mesoterricola silvestris TaxID=2927979 RepID=A0AA48GZ30_9BACT|nr:phosphate ABC transporter permease PstA [Mesoterricola silvestris]BDU73003.1 phosphate transport system permease protein PstA [Mesoterricola silvestris]
MMNLREWWRRGSALIWFSGATLAFCLLMIFGLVGYIGAKGLGFFWPAPLVAAQTAQGPILGEITGQEPDKVQFHTGNRDLFGQDYRWVPRGELGPLSTPPDVVVVERLEYGIFVGRVKSLEKDGQPLPGDPLAAIARLRPAALAMSRHIRSLDKNEIGGLNRQMEDLRLEMKGRPGLEAKMQALQAKYDAAEARLELLRAQSAAVTVTLEAVDGQTKTIPLTSVVRLVPSNRLGFPGKTGVYLSRLWEFVADDPRESNTEGGIFPAIFGTVMMVLLMSVLVVPLGVMAALYMREYARQGWILRTLRIAVNNLAGVPSIVFGVFGLGFFVYFVGGGIDRLFFADRLPAPTFGTGGILWAALTLALLTVPVVIVATEEALAAVPRSQREASLALGATRWQTLWNVVIPGAMPGILTGLILAMARGAGEVAPLMLTGVVKLAPSMPLDGTFPFLHLDRKFMHLGFHIYDVGFQSPNSEAAKPMVFMTALLLLLVVVVLNLFALRLRSRLRAKMGGGTF